MQAITIQRKEEIRITAREDIVEGIQTFQEFVKEWRKAQERAEKTKEQYIG